jgi:hypothetical protein
MSIMTGLVMKKGEKIMFLLQKEKDYI